MRSHAKAPTAGSTQRQAKSLGRSRFAPTAVLAVAIASLLAFAATPASASLLRNHESSFGSFSGESPQALAVDQSNGDVYALDTAADKVLRFSSAGTPKNFTAGPDENTNTLTGLSFQDYPSLDQVAIDNSGGPSDGNIYVTQSGSGQIKVFASSGEPLGTLTGSETPAGSLGEACGVAVDQANGDVYIAGYSNRIWRYSPSGAIVLEGDYSGGIATTINPCQLAVASGSLYAKDWQEFPVPGAGPLKKYATSEFALSPPAAPATSVANKARAVAADPSNGDVYVDEGDKVSVFNSTGSPLYSFGSGDFGSSSTGVAVRAGGNAYVSDPGAHEVDVYATTLEPGSRARLGSFGSFSGESPQALAVDQSNGDVYALDTAADKVLRFSSAGTPKNFTAGPDENTNTLTGLSFQDYPSLDQVAIDNSGGPSDGNIYVTQSGSGQIKVFASSGEPLGTLTGSETPAGSLGEACGVAVDQANGDVYIAGYSNRIWRYSPSGAIVLEGDYSGGIATTINPCQLAVASGSLYAKDWQEFPVPGAGPLKKYATSEFATGAPPSPPATTVAGKATAVATDPSNGDVYVDEGNKVSVFNSVSSPLYSFGSGDFGSSSTGVAVRAGGNAYVSDPGAHEIDVYGPFSAPPPLLETKAASNVKHTKATLHGHLDPNNSLPITGCVFEWGTDTSYGEAPIACAEGSSFTNAADVSAELTGLTPGTTYHFRLHVTTAAAGFDGEDRSFEALAPSAVPEVLTGQGSILSDTATELKATIDPSGNPLTGCRFEYVDDLYFQVTGFSDLSSGGSVPCDQAPGSIPADFEDHEVTATATGLDPEVAYRFRAVAENANGAGNGSDAFLPGPPLVETTGSSYRTTTTARLDSRLDPHAAATSYHFEYGSQGPCDANPCTATEPHPAGPGSEFELVSQQLGGLAANTTYHYRLVADNGDPDGPSFGADMTLTTRASDAPLSHGHLPGPPGSDRAWEQVNAPDTGGNPITGAFAISDNGDRAVYQISGGNPESEVGNFFHDLFSERTPTGWQPRRIYPARADAPGNAWYPPGANDDLSRIVALNSDFTSAGNSDSWLLSPDAPARRLYGVPHHDFGEFISVSDDASRVVMLFKGTFDPDHPVVSPEPFDSNLYDVTSGTPHLISLMPDGSVPVCGIHRTIPFLDRLTRSAHWVSADGSLVFFPSLGNGPCGDSAPYQIYMRDIDAGQTYLISQPPSGSPISGPACKAQFIRSTPGAAFFWTQSRLVAEDTDPGQCSFESEHGDVYRYDLGDRSLQCVTCVVSGLDADVFGVADSGQGFESIAVSGDGSRVYFHAGHHLLPGVADSAIYRVDVAGGDLAYVAPGFGINGGDNPENGSTLSPDGSVYIFTTDDADSNALNGPQNGGTDQYYRYDDADGSVLCVSCPPDGGPPRGGVLLELTPNEPGPNLTPLSDDGDLAFSTPTALVPADQNTARPGRDPNVGRDIYEWRDGRLLLVTDGLTAGVDKLYGGPSVAGVTPSGRDIFFTQPARLTPDATDAYRRLYDARIGGGFDFSPPPPPCPLDACQGTPKGAPEESRPASADFAGAGNASPAPSTRCRKGKVRRRGRCVAKKHKQRAKRAKQRADHNRRAAR